MTTPLHNISSSDDDEDSNGSLPDLHARILGKMAKSEQKLPLHTLSQQQTPIHTLSSSDDDENSSQSSSLDMVNKKNLENDDCDIIIEEISKPPANTSKATLTSVFGKRPALCDPFEDTLPEIQNFTILSSGLDYEDDELKENAELKNEHHYKPIAKKLRCEEVREEKEAKRQQRDALKQKRALEKAETKAQKDAERLCRRAMKPGECMKYVKVQLDRHMLEHPEGSLVISHLQAAEVRYEVIDSPVSCAATFLRIDPLSLQETLSEDAIIIVPVKELLELVERQIFHSGVSGLCQQCEQWKEELGIPRLTLVVAGIQAYLRGKKTTSRQNFRSAVLGDNAKRKRKKPSADEIATNVSRVDIETALVMAQLECGVNHRLISDAEKVAAFITHVTKSVAEAPYKQGKEDSAFSWYAEGSCVNSVKVDKSGVGLLKLWHQQLQQFNNVGPEVAQAIAREYPSPQALIQAYKHSTSEKEAVQLLADIPVRRGVGPLVSTRRIGPELSKKMHLFFTSVDPDVNLGQNN